MWKRLTISFSDLSVQTKNPFDFLKFFQDAINVLSSIVASCHLWIKAKRYLEIIETLSTSNIFINIWILRLLCSFCFCTALIVASFGLAYVRTCTFGLVSPDIFLCLVNSNLIQGTISHNVFESVAYVIDCWRMYCVRAVGFGLEGLIIMISLVAYHVGVDFKKNIDISRSCRRPRELKKVLQEYERLKVFFNYTNDAIKFVLVCYVLNGMLYYAINAKTMKGFDMDSLLIGYFFENYLLVFFLAVEASKKVSSYILN